MKHIILLAVLSILVGTSAEAERVTLGSSETLSPPVAVSMDWEVIRLDSNSKSLTVRYRWLAEDGAIIKLNNSSGGWLTWTCRNVETPGENSACSAENTPYDCCTGEGTGTCDGYDSTCFNDIFGFVIREQDAGTSLGAGLRTLIWNKFRSEILPGNSGSFD